MADRQLFAIVLAAGAARRFGSAKQLQEYRGTPLVTRAVRLAESVCGRKTVLIAGNEWRDVVGACAPLQGYFVHNSSYREGLSTSIARGVSSVGDSADAVLLLLADQPLISRAHLENLISQWEESPGRIAATAFADTAGPPVIFPRRYFGELCELKGDSGARTVLEKAGERVRTVECRAASVDVDTPADLDRLR
ncbi:MAG: nucleotidyltransferase family protein [Woeseia sp.]